jgi:hypothetical protein
MINGQRMLATENIYLKILWTYYLHTMAAINNKGSRQYNLIKYQVVTSKCLCNSRMVDCYLTLSEQYISYIYDKSKFTRHKPYRYKKVALIWGYGRKSRFSHWEKDIMEMVRNLCLATGYQLPLKTNCCT